jgi:uncharacterized protein YbjQ (UPF0145 family)
MAGRSGTKLYRCTNSRCGKIMPRSGGGNTCLVCGFQVKRVTSDEVVDQPPATPARPVMPASQEPSEPRVDDGGRRAEQLLIVTTNDVPGYRIVKVHGDVFGLALRARDDFTKLGTQVGTAVGDEVSGYRRLLIDSRNEARGHLMHEAAALGANAVVAMRFDCNEIGGIMTEIAAHGTAVTIAPEATRSST